MTQLSPFQTLPMLIVEKVVEYLEGHPRNLFDTDISIGMDECNMAKASRPLLWVSECWRVAALSVICDNCEISFGSSPKGFGVRYPALLPNFTFPQYHMEKLVKRVVVVAPSWSDIGSGKFGSTPSQPGFVFPVFPSAATLMVCMDEEDANPLKTGHGKLSAANAAPPNRNQATIHFARSIRCLTPAATGVLVFFSSLISTMKKNRRQCNNLVLLLCHEKTTRLDVESFTDCILATLNLRSVSGLTSIT
ncbi:hypothetical protein GGI17_006628 [Coemansia sp. S146]|nr:hypothetical protein GGI17_006628 [Coemansia sp. S146]